MTAGEKMSRKAAEFSHLPQPPNYLGPVEPDENILFSSFFLGKKNQGGLWIRFDALDDWLLKLNQAFTQKCDRAKILRNLSQGRHSSSAFFTALVNYI